jgi:hypothetical protein
MPQSRKKKSTDYQNVTLWEGDDYFASGNIVFTPEFLEDLLNKFDDGDENVIDEFSGGIKVRITIRESEYDTVDYYGNVYLSDGEKKKKKRPRDGGRRPSR